MLGQTHLVGDLMIIDSPPLVDDMELVIDFAFAAVSRYNWVKMAEKALASNQADRLNTWNLECIGTLGIPASAGLENAAPEAQFAVDGQWLTVFGDIDSGFFERFLAELERSPAVTEVRLGSGGGSVKDALLAGREIRRRGLGTSLAGNCYSACPLVFAGGVDRTKWANARDDFGFHRLSTTDGTILPDDHPFYNLIAEYLTEMGVDPVTYIGWMRQAGPDELFSPEPRDLCKPLLATFVQRICADGEVF